MKGGLGDLMQKAQQMQENMQKAQEEIAKMEVNGQSGGGLVVVTMNGKHEVSKIVIDDSLFGEDRDMLEDLIAAAVNDAVHKVTDASQNKMAGMTDGIPLPPGFKMPF